MVESVEEWSGRGKEGRHQNALFYADDGMVTSLEPRWLQGDFRTLVGLLDRVGINTNVRKTVGMICCPCQATGTQSDVAAGRQMMGEGPSYRERQRGRVQCTECGEEMALGLLAGHMQTQLSTLREEVLYVIFIDLHKAYDDLDRSRCLEILEECGMVP